MQNFSEYVTQLIPVAILGMVSVGLVGEKSLHGQLIKLISGVLLALTVIAPIVKVDFTPLELLPSEIMADADVITDDGAAMAYAAEEILIKSKIESYILDKAADCSIDITVDVTLSEGMPPVPTTVHISGNASPYARSKMTHFLSEELSIPEENQIWQ